MAYPTVCIAIAKIVAEAKEKVVDDLLAFLSTKVDIDDDMTTWFNDFKSSLKEDLKEEIKDVKKKPSKKGKKAAEESDGEIKKKRAPSCFNLYIKDVMNEVKAAHPDIKDGKKFIGFASAMWKTEPKAIFIKDKVAQLKKKEPATDIIELFARAKLMFDNDNDQAKTEEIKEDIILPIREKVAAKKTAEKATKKKTAAEPKKATKAKKIVTPVEEDSDEEEEDEEEEAMPTPPKKITTPTSDDETENNSEDDEEDD